MLTTAWNLVSHLLPVIVTLLVVVTAYLFKKFHPDFHHIYLVVQAHDAEGREALARYLAHKAGGKRIHVDQTWPGFMAPAILMHRQHIAKKDQ